MTKKSKGFPEEIRHLDEIDRRVLNILSENSRAKLTTIAKDIQLSVDSTKNRIQNLERDGVISKYTIQPSAKKIGLSLSVHVYVKLKNVTNEKYEEFVEEMKKNTRVIDLMSVLGDYDMYIVMLAKDAPELDKMKMEIRQKFTHLIDDWKEVLVTKIYKLEEYKF